MEAFRVNDMAVRLARDARDLDAVQALRYRVFFEEMGARPSAEMAKRRRDFDRFDAVCDHLVVEDLRRSRPTRPAIVGCYRLNRRSVAERSGGFYSAGEFDLAPLAAYPGEIVELGRSCVDPNFRAGVTMQLLWRGIAEYVSWHDIPLMFGCASLPGRDPMAVAGTLSYLYQNHLAPEPVRVRALDDRYVDMRLIDRSAIDPDQARRTAPPLVKGYLRVGCWVGDGAVIDEQFNTTDVFVMVETRNVTEKYTRRYIEPLKAA